ncbi:hypothetical protein KRX11_02675 [Pasteurellaceae bacterium TAE3-ERU1]|nr:hypothetical protein [Pasteurellaceae bacterium TAE3-ERU1]
MILKKENYFEYIHLRNKDITPSWNIFSGGDSNNYNAITPNKIPIILEDRVDLSFQVDKTPQYQSTMLWYHSLAWLRIIYNKYHDLNFINKYINDYYDFIKLPKSNEVFSTLTSRDHLVAEQIKNLTYLLLQPDGEIINKNKILEIVLCLTKWAILPGSIANNNHGMMLASALLHVPLFLDMPFKERNKLIKLASKRLLEIVNGAFDSSGLCNENTPNYHKFYINFLVQQICELRFLSKYEALYLSLMDDLSKILDVAKKTLNIVALPNGELPPLGDGNLTPQKLAEPLEFGEFYSSDSGFYSYKHKKLRSRYFSMKCGLSSTTHKHLDDTSIFYWYDGNPIITDAGFLNYDWRDPLNVLVKSQRGHSGAFYYKYDDFYPATLYKDNQDKNRINSNLYFDIENNNVRILTGSVCIDNKYSICRKVKFSHLNNILIIDRFIVNTPSEYLEKCVRFLIPVEHQIDIFDDYVYIYNKSFKLKLVYKGGSLIIKNGFTKDDLPYAGWVVQTPFKDLKPCNVIEIKLNPNEDFLITNLLLEELI